MGWSVVVVSRVLVAFLFRLTFGVALAMSITPARWVASGFFRVHLWVLLGLNTLAAVVLANNGGAFGNELPGKHLWSIGLAVAIVSAVLSYLGSVVWLYEKVAAGRALIGAILLAAWTGCLVSAPDTLWHASGWQTSALIVLDVVTSGALMGFMATGMLLGHYYLNWPGMKLAPLQRLIQAGLLAGVARGLVAVAGLYSHGAFQNALPRPVLILLVFRWIAGILAPMVAAAMASAALRVPNTQSATGILYAAVVLTFLGELLAQLLATYSQFPM